jgi:hypothetical protein
LLSLIRKLSSLSWEVSFNHTLREDNEYADWLVKFGTTNVKSLRSPPYALDWLVVFFLFDKKNIIWCIKILTHIPFKIMYYYILILFLKTECVKLIMLNWMNKQVFSLI